MPALGSVPVPDRMFSII